MASTLRSKLVHLVDSVAARADHSLKHRNKARQLATLAVDWVLRSEPIGDFRYPQLFVSYLHDWLREWAIDVRIVKPIRNGEDPDDVRFKTLLDQLACGVPFAPLSIVQEAGRHADSMFGRTDVVGRTSWAGDVGLHFLVSSSLGQKARLLHSIVRNSRPKSYLELGTAYGISALIAARTLAMLMDDWRLTTIEYRDQQFQISSSMLTSRFGELIDCRLGPSSQCLKDLHADSRKFDFMFHDAAHSYDDYVSDFALAEPMLGPGAVGLIDDIRWDDARFATTSNRHCYDGWRAIVAHDRVRSAAELDGGMGIILLN